MTSRHLPVSDTRSMVPSCLIPASRSLDNSQRDLNWRFYLSPVPLGIKRFVRATLSLPSSPAEMFYLLAIILFSLLAIINIIGCL